MGGVATLEPFADQVQAWSRGGLPMGSSAFEVLIIPVLWTTFGGIVAGAAILSLMNAVQVWVGRLVRTASTLEAVQRVAEDLGQDCGAVAARQTVMPLLRRVGSRQQPVAAAPYVGSRALRDHG
jgi:hypothetical protein